MHISRSKPINKRRTDGKCKEGVGVLTHLFNNVWREDSGGEGSAKDVRELLVKASNPHLLKVPVRADDGLPSISGFRLSFRAKL